MPERLPVTVRALVMMLVLALGAGTAAAQPEAAPAPAKPWAAGVSPEQQALALRAFELGNLEFFESRYAQALAHYREAIRHWDHPAIRFNMAVCLINLDQPLEARDNLERSLAFGDGPLGEDMHQQALTYRKLLDGRLARVRIACREPGADVSLDGRHLFTGPGEVEQFLMPGDHQVVATKAGYLTTSETLALVAGEATRFEARLVAYAAATATVRRWTPWKPWAVAGGGALALALGAFEYRVASRGFDDYDALVRRECPAGCSAAEVAALPALGHTHGSAERHQVLAFSLFAIGGTAVVAGAVAAILNQPRTELVPDRARSRIVPLPGGAAVTLDWRF